MLFPNDHRVGAPSRAVCGPQQVPPNYDSLLGKLIVWGEDRDQAIMRMKRALSETVISGVPTTIDYHQLILDTKDFKAGNVDTGALLLGIVWSICQLGFKAITPSPS